MDATYSDLSSVPQNVKALEEIKPLAKWFPYNMRNDVTKFGKLQWDSRPRMFYMDNLHSGGMISKSQKMDKMKPEEDKNQFLRKGSHDLGQRLS